MAKQFFLIKSDNHQCQTFEDIGDITPSDARGWRIKNLKSSAEGHFADDDRAKITKVDATTATLEVWTGAAISLKLSMSLVKRSCDDGQTRGHFLMDDTGRFFLLLFGENVSPKAILLQRYGDKDNTPASEGAIKYQEIKRRAVLLFGDEPTEIQSTQEDEGGGYLP